MSNQTQYVPDFVTPPGETLAETLEALGMSQAELGRRIGLAAATVNRIVQGREPISRETALKLEKVFRVPARFWNNRQVRYEEWLAREKERETFQRNSAWVRRFPLATMQKYGWLPPAKTVEEKVDGVLKFFGVGSPDEWEKIWATEFKGHFRHSRNLRSDPPSLAAWLRQGELVAQSSETPPYNKARFSAAIHEVRELTREAPEVFENRMREICSAAGVILVFLRELPKVCANGACFWHRDHPVILLNIRHKTDDHLWFTFFHEARHVLQNVRKDRFIDEAGTTDGDLEEDANSFAANVLIPAAAYRQFTEHGDYSYQSVREFAGQLGIAPGIVVGRLQHDRLVPFSHLNRLKRKLVWAA